MKKRKIPKSQYFFQRMDGVLLLSFLASEAEVISVAKDFGLKMTKPYSPGVNIDGHINYFGYIWDDVRKQAQAIISKIEKELKFLSRLAGMWQERVKKLRSYEQRILKIPLKGISDEELVKIFRHMVNLYQAEYSPALLCDSFSFHAEQIVTRKLGEVVRERGESRKFAHYLAILTAIPRQSFMSEEELNLLFITKKVKMAKALALAIKKNVRGAKEMLVKYPSLSKMVKKHQTKFFWIENSYAQGIKLNEAYFLKRIRNFLKEGLDIEYKIAELKSAPRTSRQQKRHLIKKLDLDGQFREILKWIEFFGWLHDTRKAVMMECYYYFSIILKEIGRRLGLTLDEMYYIDHYKIEEMVLKRKVDRSLIRQRRKLCAYFIWPDRYKIIAGRQAQVWKRLVLGGQYQAVQEIKGISASVGTAVGKAKIVKSIKDGSMIRKGDILVASMTRPHWMPFIKKASAIITEEGGITCHAAIVARELNIPCIIGTKIATKVLKNGMLVEVRANHGVVRIIK